MKRYHLFITLGIVQIILLTLLGIFFYRLDERSTRAPESPSVEKGTEKLPECRKTGCSSHICADEDIATTCEFLPEYACYADGECERQPDGQCGFTPTETLSSCLEQAVKSRETDNAI